MTAGACAHIHTHARAYEHARAWDSNTRSSIQFPAQNTFEGKKKKRNSMMKAGTLSDDTDVSLGPVPASRAGHAKTHCSNSFSFL